MTVDLGNDGMAPLTTFAGATGPLALVQTATAPSVTATSLTVTLPTATTAGHTLVAAITTGPGSVTVTGVTTGALADNWAQAETQVDSGGRAAFIWVDPGCAGGQTSVTVSISASASIAVRVYEFSGLLTAGVVDQATGATAGAATAWSSGATGVTAQAAEIAFGLATVIFNVSMTGPPGWTTFADLRAGNVPVLSGFLPLSGQQAVTFAGTNSPAGTSWAAMVVTLRETTTGGTAQAVIGPSGGGDLWSLDQCYVSTSVGQLDPSQCTVFVGPLPLPQYAAMASLAGGGAQFGMGGLGCPFGWFVWALWTGGIPGATGNLRVTGTKTTYTN